jgi:hypothetical protein
MCIHLLPGRHVLIRLEHTAYEVWKLLPHPAGPLTVSQQVYEYLLSTCQDLLVSLYDSEYAVDSEYGFEFTLWMQRSTSRLYVDLVPTNDESILDYGFSNLQAFKPLAGLTHEAMVIDDLRLNDFETICWVHLSQLRTFLSPPP